MCVYIYNISAARKVEGHSETSCNARGTATQNARKCQYRTQKGIQDATRCGSGPHPANGNTARLYLQPQWAQQLHPKDGMCHYNPDLAARRQSRRRRGHLCRYGRIAMVSGPLHRIPRRFYNYVRQRTGVPKRKLEMGSLLSYTPNRSHMTNYEPPEKDYRRWRRRTVKLSRRPYIASGIWPKGTSHYGA